MSLLLGLKLFLAPFFVWIISVLQGRYNARLGGLFLGLPLTTGPFLLIIGLQEGRSFAKTAAHVFKGINSPTETFGMIEFKKYKSIQHPLQAIFALGQRSIPKYG